MNHKHPTLTKVVACECKVCTIRAIACDWSDVRAAKQERRAADKARTLDRASGRNHKRDTLDLRDPS